MAVGAVPSAHDPQHNVRWRWLLLAACALAFVALCSAVIDVFGLGGKPCSPIGTPCRFRLTNHS